MLFPRAPYHFISHQASICGPGTYSPGDNCGKASGGLEFRAEKRGPFGVWEGIQK